MSSQMLVHLDPKLDIRVTCDASNYSNVGVLCHQLSKKLKE